MLTHPLFDSIETRYATDAERSGVRDLGPGETLRIVFRDADLHLYVTPADTGDPAAAYELHVVHTKITRFTQELLVLEGFAVPDRAGQPYPRVGVTLRRRGDLGEHAGRLAGLGAREAAAASPDGAASDGTPSSGAAAVVAPPASHAGFTRLSAAGGVSGVDLPYLLQRSPEQPPVRGTIFVDHNYLARYAHTDPATGQARPVHDPDAVRRLAMTSTGLARPAHALDAGQLVRTDTFAEVWNTLFAPALGERGV